MDKLKINLIPPEIKQQEKREKKRFIVIEISVGLLGILILATAGILAVIIFQNATLKSLNAEIEQEKSKITGLKENEAVVFFLKNRIDTINKFSNSNNKQGEKFELVNSLVPPEVSLSSMQIDNTSAVNLQGETNSPSVLDAFFNNLMDAKKNEGKVASVSVEGLSRGQSGRIVFSLVVSMSD